MALIGRGVVVVEGVVTVVEVVEGVVTVEDELLGEDVEIRLVAFVVVLELSGRVVSVVVVSNTSTVSPFPSLTD